MLAISRTLASSKASIVTVESVLSAIGSAPPTPCVPKWSPRLIAGSAGTGCVPPGPGPAGRGNGGRGAQRGGALALSGPQGIRGPRARCGARPAGGGRKTAPPAGLGQSVVGRGSPASDRAMARQCFGDVDRRRPRPNPLEHPGQAPLARSWRAGCAKSSPTVRSPNAGRPHCRGSRRSTSNRSSAGFGRRGSARKRWPSRARRLSQGSDGSWGAMLRRMIGFQPSGSRGSAPRPSPNGC